MTMLLRQSTAIDIGIGPFYDTSGVPQTALSIAQADVQLKKGAANWAQKNQSSTATHELNGWYEASLNAADTNTLGSLIVAVYKSGALPVHRVFLVVPANVFDSLVSGSDALQVHTNEITPGLIVAATFGASAIDAAALAADAGSEIAAAVRTNLTTELGRIDVATSTRLASSSYTTPPTAIENADALLKRDWTAVTGEAARSVLNALRFLRNKWSIGSGTLTVTTEDDTTTAWQATLSSSASADPVIGSDPT